MIINSWFRMNKKKRYNFKLNSVSRARNKPFSRNIQTLIPTKKKQNKTPKT